MADPVVLEQQAAAAYLEGRDAESAELWSRAHHEWLSNGRSDRAARAAFWLAFGLLQRGEHARANGWLARAQRLLESFGKDCVERGYLLFPAGVLAIFAGKPAEACEILAEAARIGERFHDVDLTTLARNAEGRARVRAGDVFTGMRLLDEAMAAVEAGEVNATVAGDVYCSMIEACQETFDLRRAHEWTSALSRWCERQPDLVAYRGQCLTRRAEMLQVRGAWDEAAVDAEQACARLSNPPPPQRAVGAALYQRAELARLRGHFAEAESLYHEASHWDTKARPGLALLRLAQHQTAAAFEMARAQLSDTHDAPLRTRLLAAFVEIALEHGDVAAARSAANELSTIASRVDMPALNAEAAYAEGAVLLAEGDAAGATTVLRRALSAWQQLDAPYGAARAGMLIAQAAHARRDHTTADFEIARARTVFERLHAQPDLDKLTALARSPDRDAPAGLTTRELEVLRLLAQGHTNKRIGEALFISEKTVARHVANIFMKLGISTRAAAAAYAFQHHLA
jgi:ATP/maltotriose-dependent transcriptional regulator MalT